MNRVCASARRFRSTLLNSNMATAAACECGAENQIAEHFTTDRPLYSPLFRTDGLVRLGEDTTSWLLETSPDV